MGLPITPAQTGPVFSPTRSSVACQFGLGYPVVNFIEPDPEIRFGQQLFMVHFF